MIKAVGTMQHYDILVPSRPATLVNPVEIPLEPEDVRPVRHRAGCPSLCRQASPAPDPSPLEDIAAIACLHPLAESVLFLPLPFFRLIGHFHNKPTPLLSSPRGAFSFHFYAPAYPCPSSKLQSGRHLPCAQAHKPYNSIISRDKSQARIKQDKRGRFLRLVRQKGTVPASWTVPFTDNL